jgi:hypothetical protein
MTIDDAIKRILELGHGSSVNKADIQDTFKLLPVNPSFWPFYGIRWISQYFFSVRLPFGSRSSPIKLFDMLSEAIVWIAEHNYGIPKILHLLDDFFVVDGILGKMEIEQRHLFRSFLIESRKPLSTQKTMGPV